MTGCQIVDMSLRILYMYVCVCVCAHANADNVEVFYEISQLSQPTYFVQTKTTTISGCLLLSAHTITAFGRLMSFVTASGWVCVRAGISKYALK